MTTQNKDQEKKMCELCGDNNYEVMYHIVFTDGEEDDGCNNCLTSYFTEIPDEIASVKKIDAKIPSMNEKIRQLVITYQSVIDIDEEVEVMNFIADLDKTIKEAI